MSTPAVVALIPVMALTTIVASRQYIARLLARYRNEQAAWAAARAAHGLPARDDLDFPAWVNGEPDDGEAIDARGASIGAGLAQHLPGPDAA